MIRHWNIGFGFAYVVSDFSQLIMVLYSPKLLISNTKDISPRSLPRGSLGHVRKMIFLVTYFLLFVNVLWFRIGSFRVHIYYAKWVYFGVYIVIFELITAEKGCTENKWVKFRQIFPFYPPWKNKTRGFWCFLGVCKGNIGPICLNFENYKVPKQFHLSWVFCRMTCLEFLEKYKKNIRQRSF